MGRVAYSGNYNKEETLKPWSFQGFGGGTTKPTGAYNLDNSSSKETNVCFVFL